MSGHSGRERQPSHLTVVEALLRAGISRETVLAMERWKAAETLQLLDPGLLPTPPVPAPAR